MEMLPLAADAIVLCSSPQQLRHSGDNAGDRDRDAIVRLPLSGS